MAVGEIINMNEAALRTTNRSILAGSTSSIRMRFIVIYGGELKTAYASTSSFSYLLGKQEA
jgi:hypothetical protein